MRALAQQAKALGWGGPQALSRQIRALAKLERLAYVLDQLCTSLEGTVAEQAQQAQQEEAVWGIAGGPRDENGEDEEGEEDWESGGAGVLTARLGEGKCGGAGGAGTGNAGVAKLPPDAQLQGSAAPTASQTSLPGSNGPEAGPADTRIQLAEVGGGAAAGGQGASRRSSVLSPSGRKLALRIDLQDVLPAEVKG
jgi:hypothetical protein